jgi:hypothetical protein
MFINQNVWSSSYKDGYQPHWLSLLLQRQQFINHTGWSSSYTCNVLSTTMVDPPTQTLVYQPHCPTQQLFINHNGWSYTGDGLSTTLVVPPPTKTMVYQPHWMILPLHRQLFDNHNGWASPYTYNCLTTTLVGPPLAYTMVYKSRRFFFFPHSKRLSYIVRSHHFKTRICQPQYRGLPLYFLLKHILTHSLRILKDYPLSFKSRYRTLG